MAGNIVVTGTITCASADLEMISPLLQEHVRLTRQEPGCLSFSIEQSDANPCVFRVDERFENQAAFDAHTARTRASVWWEKSRQLTRDFAVSAE